MSVLTNRAGLPDPVVLAVSNDPYDAGKCHISVTRLITPPQILTLLERHGQDITEDVLDRLWAMFGQVAHLIAERAGNANAEAKARYVFEKRLTIEVPTTGWTLSGQLDLYDKKENCIQDYKFVGEYAIMKALDEGKPEWEQQLNILRWLMMKVDGILVDKLEIVALARDLNARTKHPAAVIKFPVWDLDAAEEFIIDRIKQHQDARKLPDESLPRCSDSERWYNPKTGQFNRCEKYCPVRNVCVMWANAKAKN